MSEEMEAASISKACQEGECVYARWNNFRIVLEIVGWHG
jgi:hypothetical protein